MAKKKFQKYIDYIENTGGSPKLEWFITDWEPIGKIILLKMMENNLVDIVVDETDRRIELV